jgi:DNA-binding transcriptional ArsR family regulator
MKIDARILLDRLLTDTKTRVIVKFRNTPHEVRQIGELYSHAMYARLKVAIPSVRYPFECQAIPNTLGYALPQYGTWYLEERGLVVDKICFGGILVKKDITLLLSDWNQEVYERIRDDVDEEEEEGAENLDINVDDEWRND